MIKIISNGNKWAETKPWLQEPETIEALKEMLKTQILDPTFEKCGNFINNNPQWLKEEAKELYKGCSVIFGNFQTYSHVFNIITDDKQLIAELQELINTNKNTLQYQEYKRMMA
jgi:molybdopterin converting factor small subunit